MRSRRNNQTFLKIIFILIQLKGTMLSTNQLIKVKMIKVIHIALTLMVEVELQVGIIISWVLRLNEAFETQ